MTDYVTGRSPISTATQVHLLKWTEYGYTSACKRMKDYVMIESEPPETVTCLACIEIIRQNQLPVINE